MSQHTGVSSVCLPWDGGGSGDRRRVLSWAAMEEEGLNLTQQLWELAPESCVLTAPHKLTYTPTTHVDKSYLCVHLCACVCACVCFLSPKGNERWNSRTLKQRCLFPWSSIKCLPWRHGVRLFLEHCNSHLPSLVSTFASVREGQRWGRRWAKPSDTYYEMS